MKFTEILPGKLYQSAEFKKILTAEDKLSILEAAGIDVVINVYKGNDKELANNLYEYIYHPIPDGKLSHYIATIELPKIAERAVQLFHEGHVVLTHCHAGRNRSGLVNALIVMKYLKVTGNEALEIVRRKRPRAIDNAYFEEYLRSLT